MPVEYKLRTLRRLFGGNSFFRQAKGGKGAASSAAKISQVPTDASADSADGGADVEELFADYPARTRTTAEDDASATLGRSRGRQGGAAGGVPRAFFHGTPPRSIRNKSVAGQLNIVHLIEKQKMRVYYGAMRDSRFKRYVEEARRVRYNVDAELMRLLELRLDTVLYRTGFVQTPMQARQWISHNKVLVNGCPLNIRSARLRPGDEISIRESFAARALEASEAAAALRERVGAGQTWVPATGGPEGMLPWLVVDRRGLAAVLIRPPDDDEARGMCRAALYPFIRDAQLKPLAAMRAYR